MKFVKASENDLNIVYDIVSNSIKTSLLKCYNQEVVDFFLTIHSRQNILKDIKNNDLYMIKDNDTFVGTGFANKNHISLIYIKPNYQGRGYGSAIMDFLENKISANYDNAILDPTKDAIEFYSKRGYKLISHEDTYLSSGTYLAHDIMKKDLIRK